jgi:outer membrane receptor protein involved in Fe transport
MPGSHLKTWLFVTTALVGSGSAAAQEAANQGQGLETVVVTGTTSGNRSLLTSSSDVTYADSADIQRRAPRSTADVLDLVPGIFVESTAGPVSNNYSVRGLQGGAQTFITLEEDGMPVIYFGGGADEYFQNDITVDHVESVAGGSSGILSVNGAAATINFISRRPSITDPVMMARLTGASYGEKRADVYYSAPLKLLGDGWGFSVGGYIDSTPGVRDSPFTYDTFHIKGTLERRLPGDGYIRFSIRHGDEHDPYYADMPYRVNQNGDVSGVPGLSPLYGNIAGAGFSEIQMPDSCATGNCLRTFSLAKGIHTTTTRYRLDAEVPVSSALTAFMQTRFMDANFDFNGIFPGSGSGNAGLAPVGTYLIAGDGSPIDALLMKGLATFPNISQFGIKDLRSGQILTAATATNLNGNGLLQQTVLNRQTVRTADFGSNFGLRFDMTHGQIDNSLTIGGMYYNISQVNDQSGVSTLINDVRSNSHIYDVVGLNAAGDVVGTLTNNGLISYGNWGQGIYRDNINSESVYFNDEMTIAKDLHIDFGLRYEFQHVSVLMGNTAPVNAPVPAGTAGLAQDVGSTFDGTYTRAHHAYNGLASTAGINYTLSENLAFYVRYATGFQTYGGDTGGTHKPTHLLLYEGGARYQGHGLVATVTVFRTEFNNQYYSFIQPDNPAVQGSFLADMATTGVSYDLVYSPIDEFRIAAYGVWQSPELSNVSINGTPASAYNGNTPARTPKWLFTVSPSFVLPDGLGEIYMRYKYTGSIFADSGNGLSLPGYGVLSAGFNLNLSDRVGLNLNVDNITDEVGLTEGNPRQGQTQSVTNGYFYGRGIVGMNAMASLNFTL